MSSGARVARTAAGRRDGAPTFYFSFRSPYSWLAYHDLEDRHREIAARLRWVPFWEPDAWSARLLEEAGGAVLYSAMSRAKHLYILQDVRRQAARRGLDITWPVDRSPCWEVPHLGYLFAARHGLGREFAALVYRARWQQGRDICDRGTVGELGQALGLDGGAVAHAADDADVRREGVDALLAVHRDGVFGVPFFVNRFDKFWGMDRLEAFVESLEGPGAPSYKLESVAARSDAGAAMDHAGGCG